MAMRADLSVFRRHLRVFLLVWLLVPLCVWIAMQRATPLYTATGALIYEPGEYKPRELQSILQNDPITEAVMASQAEVLRGLKIAQRVADRGGLYDDPAFNPALRPPSAIGTMLERLRLWAGVPARPDPSFGPVADATREATIVAVRDALRVVPVKYSHVLEVSFTAPSPLVAAAAVNNAMDIYIKDQFSAKAGAVRRATDWLNQRATALRAEVRAQEDRIATYRAEHQFAHGMHADLAEERITHLNEDLIKARADLAAADAKLDVARGRAGAAAQAAIAPSMMPLRTRLDEATAHYQALSATLGAAHPDGESARRQMEAARQAVEAEIARVVSGTEQDRRAATERVTALEENLRQARTDADEEAKARIPLNAMERDADASRQQLQVVLERIQQTAQQHALETSEAHEISLALPPREPSWPRPERMMAAAVGAGAALGLLLIWLLNMTDSTLHGGEDVRGLTDRPCFALVPELRRRDLGAINIEDFAVRRPLTAFAEQIRAVRAALWMGAERPRVVAITAARAAEGKSVLAVSLARSTALGGEKVLLIDCDMRNPALGRALRAEDGPGLSDLLRGAATLGDVLHADPSGGMHFIPAGRVRPDAIGLFMGTEMAQLLADARREYNLVVLDTPPIQAITEARVLAMIADVAVLCVRWRVTPAAVVRYALDLLEDAHAHIAGIVLTRVDPRAHVRSGYADAEVYHPRYNAYHSG
jgi:capsular exopolysaccharide synthesis family protein